MIISNRSEKNHLSTIRELSSKSDSLVFVSPFLFSDFDDFLDQILGSSIKQVTLFTTLKPEMRDMTFKCSSFVSLVDYFSNKKAKLSIHINNRLHGKVYIFLKDGSYVGCIVSSANLTENGMIKNHEWGVTVEGKDDIESLHKEILGSIEYPELTEDKIIELMLETDKYYQMINKQGILEKENKPA